MDDLSRAQQKQKVEQTPDHVGLKTDIRTNDPTSSITHDKLRKVLASGAFHFNSKEREVLGKILGETVV